MTFLPIFVFIVSYLLGKGIGYSAVIHCYECDDCKTLNDSLLRECPKTASTITPNILISDLTTVPFSSTLSTPIPLTNPSTTPAPITTTTNPPDTTEQSPVAEDHSTLAPSPTTTTEVVEVEKEDNNEEKETVLKRSVRYVSYRSIMISRIAREAKVSYHCYSIKGYGDNRKKIKKGCVEVIGIQNACDVLKEQYGNSIENCKICREDKCNSNSAVQNLYSIGTLALIFLIGFIVQNVKVFMK